MVLILGSGYTGKRVAANLARSGCDVVTTNRNADAPALRFDLDDPASLSTIASRITPETRVLYSIPAVSLQVMRVLERAKRLVYLSTTGVYGSHVFVDAGTPVDEGHARVVSEHLIQTHPSALILRPAAIYGPGRGIQVSIAAGTFRLAGDGSNSVSRIHVDDLAAHCVAALFSEVTGAYPVADDEPCESREIAAFCAALLNVPMPDRADPQELHPTRQANRRVDGREIRRLLGIELKYPSYRVGIPASTDRAF
ncbi:NAD-dependent epimerase/dehydratase family protein [Nevskia soli]|uniref:NAD-dependent epimerase/dehydratase family protein n=1 Tax=Nevskia soli TaxID=418856 RepID=UPI0015D87AFD|nr:NAD-dependent epimerase/dehydratase family protein [Nevskia soli]